MKFLMSLSIAVCSAISISAAMLALALSATTLYAGVGSPNQNCARYGVCDPNCPGTNAQVLGDCATYGGQCATFYYQNCIDCSCLEDDTYYPFSNPTCFCG
jgi:hypothetical protein